MAAPESNQKDNHNHTENFQAVWEAEKNHILPKKAEENYMGLALSGGGIRSASFGLGVLQALYGADELENVDYLSTVSGGGYIGSSLTWFLEMGIPKAEDSDLDSDSPSWRKNLKELYFPYMKEVLGFSGIQKPSFKNTINASVSPKTKPEEGRFPFGEKGTGNRIDSWQSNAILDYIRQHGDYLLPGKGLDRFYLTGVVFRTLAISFIIHLLLLTSVMALLRMPHYFDRIGFSEGWIGYFQNINWLLFSAVCILFLLILTAFLFSLFTGYASLRGCGIYLLSLHGQRILSSLWKVMLFLLLLGSLSPVSEYLGNTWRGIVTGLLNGTGIFIFLKEYRNAFASASPEKRGVPGFLLILGASALLYGFLLLAYLLSGCIDTGSITLMGILVVSSIGLSVFVNLNDVGMGRVYRDRLMETFLPNESSVLRKQWESATCADKALLQSMCQKQRRPYHLINANVVLINSPAPKFRGRGGDSFILSPLYCGSDATGWRTTESYIQKGCLTSSRGITLATAMAISGAAVNSNSAPAGCGVTRNKLVSLLMTWLNLRLGYWTHNPKKKKITSLPPNFLIPGLKACLLNCGFTEENTVIELSDGGHFENLGLYELIRRKCTLIIVSDAAADSTFRFGDLANAIERVRVDFGAKIRFEKDWDIDGLLPAEDPDPFKKKYKLSKRAFSIAAITYEDDTEGKLIYLKTTLTDGLPADIYGYKSDNPLFPDQSTADQFFDEKQFEAYRELGYQLTKRMVETTVIKNILKQYRCRIP